MHARHTDVPDPAPLHTLTAKQQQILDTIDRVTAATGEPCGLRYLARRHNVALTTMREHLFALHRRGWLRTPGGPALLTRRPQR